jgi:hypothetical protein
MNRGLVRREEEREVDLGAPLDLSNLCFFQHQIESIRTYITRYRYSGMHVSDL